MLKGEVALWSLLFIVVVIVVVLRGFKTKGDSCNNGKAPKWLRVPNNFSEALLSDNKISGKLSGIEVTTVLACYIFSPHNEWIEKECCKKSTMNCRLVIGVIFLFLTHLNNCWHFWTALNLGNFPKQRFLCGFVFRGLKPSRDVVRYTCRQRAEKEIGEWSLVSQYFVIVRITQNEYEQDKNAVYSWTQAKCCIPRTNFLDFAPQLLSHKRSRTHSTICWSCKAVREFLRHSMFLLYSVLTGVCYLMFYFTMEY